MTLTVPCTWGCGATWALTGHSAHDGAQAMLQRIHEERECPRLTCECGHPIREHQTGEGMWTGFCYADASTDTDPTAQCKCESPTQEGGR